jgi:hypothetical protein
MNSFGSEEWNLDPNEDSDSIKGRKPLHKLSYYQLVVFRSVTPCSDVEGYARRTTHLRMKMPENRRIVYKTHFKIGGKAAGAWSWPLTSI